MLRIAFALVLAAISAPAAAQTGTPLPADAEQTLRDADAGYWKAFNACDPAAMAPFLAEDLEFYHDKGGVTRTRAGMIDATMKGICGNPNVRVRRAPLPETIRFDPIPGYGAVLSGRHAFFLTEKGMPERQSGVAAFDILWRYDQGHWQIARAFSIGHQPVDYVPPPGVALPAAALARHAGRYRLPDGEARIAVAGDHLVMTTGTLTLTLAAKAADHFFARERPLQIDFDGGTLTVVEEANPVATGKRID